MKTSRFFQSLTLLTALSIGACQDGGPTEPVADLPEILAVEEELTLEVLADPTSTEVALSMIEAQSGAAYRRGKAWASSDELTAQAEHHFRNAEQAFVQGDLVRAMEQHREGRRLVAQAMQGAGGPRAIQGQLERLESFPVMVGADPDCYQDPQGFAQQLGKLAQGARHAYGNGDRIRAGQMGVLAEQAVQKRQRDQDNILADHPEVRVALGAEAIELANQLLPEGTATEEQMDLLALAVEYQEKAEEADDVRWAIHFARQAQWWALKAVVLPGGITDEEAQFILDQAKTLYDEAVNAVGQDPDELQAALLEKAARMLEVGEANLSNGTCRGLGALWQVAVISSYLLPS